MKAITLWQPWAQAIALGLKRIETRSWATHYRGPVAIHAAKRPLPDMTPFAGIFPDGTAFPPGAVIAITSIEDCLPMTEAFISGLSGTERLLGVYAPGRFAWILGPIRPLQPVIPISGHQGLWNWKQM
ncbi:MAG TPA: 2-oxoglutarate dehydrogenase E1 [Rhodospirillaceae bacterium]|nr:MAG: hypothetical protein A2018_06030 [Alphaproteobacteria bacterium GWF2_58_20]HAU29070.1 2-oxoglutarate dehydrogenase E1 [Rhodospirillaceae bacterium]